MRKKIFVVLFLIACCFLALTCLQCNKREVPTQFLDFEQVNRLEDEPVLVAARPGARLVFLNSDGSLKRELNLSEEYDIDVSEPTYKFRFGGSIAVSPDGSRLYVSFGKTIFEFDCDGVLIRRIPLKEFSLDDAGQYVISGMEAGIDYIWFKVTSLETEKCFIIEWNTQKPPQTRLFSPQRDDWDIWAVVPGTHKVLTRLLGTVDPNLVDMLLKNTPEIRNYETNDANLPRLTEIIPKEIKGGIYDFETGQFTEKRWDKWWSFCDLKQDAFLFSRAVCDDSSSFMFKTDSSCGNPVSLAGGAQAQWGIDGHIYFQRGSNQLWRFRTDTQKTELVCGISDEIRGGDFGYPSTLCLSPDRRYLAFYYWLDHDFVNDTHSFRDTDGLILLDLQKLQWVDLSDLRSDPIKIRAWLMPQTKYPKTLEHPSEKKSKSSLSIR